MQHLDSGTHTGVDYYQYMWDLFMEVVAEPGAAGMSAEGGANRRFSVGESQILSWTRSLQLELLDFQHVRCPHKNRLLNLVSKQDAATVLPIIERVVAPGSVITSDEWAV